MSDPKDRLKQWAEDGYIDADLRNTFKDALTRIEHLEAENKALKNRIRLLERDDTDWTIAVRNQARKSK